MSDRRIHARTSSGRLIVRYDRAGKWYAETENTRQPLTFGEAVAEATLRGSYVYFGQPGGSRFDSAVRRKAGRSA